VKDIIDGKDLSFAQKERLLNRNAVDFFKLKNLPQPSAVKIASRSWTDGSQLKAATA
jgi:hypothetical protein